MGKKSQLTSMQTLSQNLETQTKENCDNYPTCSLDTLSALGVHSVFSPFIERGVPPNLALSELRRGDIHYLSPQQVDFSFPGENILQLCLPRPGGSRFSMAVLLSFPSS